jgi:hypothetical protein
MKHLVNLVFYIFVILILILPYQVSATDNPISFWLKTVPENPNMRYYLFSVPLDTYPQLIIAATDNPTVITDLENELALEQSERTKHINGFIDYGNGGHNYSWDWHFIPSQWTLADVSIEVCDGTPAMVNDDLDYWINTVKSFCPWSSRVVKELTEDDVILHPCECGKIAVTQFANSNPAVYKTFNYGSASARFNGSYLAGCNFPKYIAPTANGSIELEYSYLPNKLASQGYMNIFTGNQLTKKLSHTPEYGPHGFISKVTLQCSRIDDYSTNEFFYDDQDRLVQEINTTPANCNYENEQEANTTNTYHYEYNEFPLLPSRVDYEDFIIEYNYKTNQAGLITSIKEKMGYASEYENKFTYDENHRIIRKEYIMGGGSIVYNYVYDAEGRIILSKDQHHPPDWVASYDESGDLKSFEVQYYSDGESATLVFNKDSQDIVPDLVKPISLVKLYPNPVSSYLNICFILTQDVKLITRIFALDGKMLWQAPMQSYPLGMNSLTWDKRDLTNQPVPAGVYYIKLDSTISSISNKIVVIR